MSDKVVKTNRCDGNAIKRALDDSLIKFITENQALREDSTLANWVLLISFVSVILALSAQFYPAPFPQNWHILAICCPSYFVLSGILQYIQTFIEKDFILFTLPEHLDSKGIQFATKLPKYEYDYTLSISERDTGRNLVTKTTPVYNWIDEEGVLNETIYHAHIKKMLDEYLANEKKKK